MSLTNFPNGINAGEITGTTITASTGFVGDVTGAITGDIAGDVTGDVTGNVVGAIQHTVVEYAEDGAIAIAAGVAVLTKGTAGAYTIAAPTADDDDGLIIYIVAATAQQHVVTATTIGYNAANTGGDIGTFGGAIGDSITLVAHGGEWLVLSNQNVTITGSV